MHGIKVQLWCKFNFDVISIFSLNSFKNDVNNLIYQSLIKLEWLILGLSEIETRIMDRAKLECSPCFQALLKVLIAKVEIRINCTFLQIKCIRDEIL